LCRNILAAIIEKIPPPSGEVTFQALIFDSHYNPFRGIVILSEKRQIKRPKN
jgi:GTP-binding protein LepA